MIVSPWHFCVTFLKNSFCWKKVLRCPGFISIPSCGKLFSTGTQLPGICISWVLALCSLSYSHMGSDFPREDRLRKCGLQFSEVSSTSHVIYKWWERALSFWEAQIEAWLMEKYFLSHLWFFFPCNSHFISLPYIPLPFVAN